MVFRKWLLLLIIFFLANNVFAQTEDVDQDISALMQKYGAIGMSFAVVKDNNIVYSRSMGFKDSENQILLQTKDLFRIASVSKTFVATAIMQLVEKGKLSLEDDVNSYLNFRVRNPKYPNVPITIKMLLCHRSSINDGQGYKNFEKIISPTNELSAKCFSDYMPDDRFSYCNLNYNLLGAIIENVTKKRFDKYIYRNIIKPLGLHGSFNVLGLDSTLFVKAYSYNNKRNIMSVSNETYLPYKDEIRHYRLGHSTPFLSPAGGMKITIEELAKYMIMHINGGIFNKKRILSSESERMMRQAPSQNHGYALSFLHYNNIISGEELIGQTGGAFGIHTAMIFHPSKKYGFVIFCNGCKSKSTNGQEMNFEIINKLFERLVMPIENRAYSSQY